MRIFIYSWLIGQGIYLIQVDAHPNWNLVFCACLCFILYLGYFNRAHLFSYRWMIVLPIFLFLGMGGYIWVGDWDAEKRNQQLDPTLEDKVLHLQGYIDALPQVSEKGVNLVIHVEESAFPLPEKVALFYPSGKSKREFIPGECWAFDAQIKKIHGYQNPYGFDVEQWMFIRETGANGIIRKNSAKKIATAIPPRYFFERLRYVIRNKIFTTLGDQARYAGVMSALVIGDQGQISAQDWQMFSATGIGHLISISGLHITMLAAMGASLGSWCWRKGTWIYFLPAQKFSILIGFLTGLFYTCLAGFQIPAQRTTLMLGVGSLGLFLGRILLPFDIWLWALWVVLVMNPWAVYYPGFWLSFGAVAAILYALPRDVFKTHDVDLLFFQKLRKSLLEAARVQAVITIALIPISLYWFYQISMISPIANAIAIPVISFIVTPFAMLGAFLPGILGQGFLWLAHATFSVLADCLYPLSDISWAVIHGKKPSGFFCGLSFVGVLLCIQPGPIGKYWQQRLIGLIFCLSLFIPRQWSLWERIPYGDIEMVVWDIGQGSAILIQTQQHFLIYDTGPISFGKFNPGEKIIIPHLRAQGISSVDQLMISHEDADHIGGLEFLIKNFPIQKVVGSIPPEHRLQDIFRNNRVPFQACQAQTQWQWDGVEFRIWHPGELTQKPFLSLKPNDRSCVLEIRNQSHSVWLTGDIEKIGEAILTRKLLSTPEELDAIQRRELILMAPHHGSKTSSSEALIRVLNPTAVFSQSGYKNRYRHPHPLIVDRYQQHGLQLLDTTQTGAQIWRIRQQSFDKEFWRSPENPSKS
jgi:competence protein ComEC